MLMDEATAVCSQYVCKSMIKCTNCECGGSTLGSGRRLRYQITLTLYLESRLNHNMDSFQKNLLEKGEKFNQILFFFLATQASQMHTEIDITLKMNLFISFHFSLSHVQVWFVGLQLLC